MKKTVFIQSNASQYLGALLSKYSIERFLPAGSDISVEILHVEYIDAFKKFVGKTYKQGNQERTYALDDEQSFTLTRLMAPERMNYEGRGVVIDPDVFAVQDMSALFDIDLQGKQAACCLRAEAGFWDTSVLLSENEKLEWSIEKILSDLHEQKMNYNTAIRKVLGADVLEIPRIWNNLDEITDDTRMVHMTRQRTQPWKTGLPFTVTKRDAGKMFGLIPREWLPGYRDKYPSHYQEHPDTRVKDFFFTLVGEALESGAIKEEDVKKEVDAHHIRPDIFEQVARAQTT